MDIALLGQHFRISTDEDDQYLSTLISHYQTLIETVQRTTSASNEKIVAILAGLLAVDEYYKLRQKSDTAPASASHTLSPSGTAATEATRSETEEAIDITNSMLSKIDEII